MAATSTFNFVCASIELAKYIQDKNEEERTISRASPSPLSNQSDKSALELLLPVKLRVRKHAVDKEEELRPPHLESQPFWIRLW